MTLRAVLRYDERTDLLTTSMSHKGEVTRHVAADGLQLELSRAGAITDLSIDDFSTFTRFDILYVLCGASLMRALSEYQLQIEEGTGPATLAIEFDPPPPATRDRNAKILADADHTFTWVS